MYVNYNQISFKGPLFLYRLLTYIFQIILARARGARPFSWWRANIVGVRKISFYCFPRTWCPEIETRSTGGAERTIYFIFLEILHSFGEITFIKERIFIKNYKSCINKDFFPQELKFFLQIQLMASLVRGERYLAAIFFSVGALVMCLVRWDLF